MRAEKIRASSAAGSAALLLLRAPGRTTRRDDGMKRTARITAGEGRGIC
jgi:hypothetical protein